MPKSETGGNLLKASVQAADEDEAAYGEEASYEDAAPYGDEASFVEVEAALPSTSEGNKAVNSADFS